MKSMHRVRTRKWFFLLLLGVSKGSVAQQFSFDRLFPANTFTQALDVCMQVYGNLELLKEQEETIQDRMLLTDLAAGRLVRLQEAVEQFVGDKKIQAADDAVYLLQVMQRMQQEIRMLFQSNSIHQHSKLGTLLETAKKRLEMWVSTKY